MQKTFSSVMNNERDAILTKTMAHQQELDKRLECLEKEKLKTKRVETKNDLLDSQEFVKSKVIEKGRMSPRG